MAEQKRLFRSSADRVLGGVAGGLAQYMQVDPVFVRIAFVLLALFQGIGLIIYLIMWLVVPDEASASLNGEAVIRANAEDMRARVQQFAGSIRAGSQGPLLVGALLVSLGIMFLLREFGLPTGVLWPLVLIGLGAFLLFARR
jgi:phage shock protein C